MLVTAVVVGLLAHHVGGLAGPAAIVIGNGLALSSTAVVLQVNMFASLGFFLLIFLLLLHSKFTFWRFDFIPFILRVIKGKYYLSTEKSVNIICMWCL